MKIKYTRVSTKNQYESLDHQIQLLKKSKCREVYSEVVSGAKPIEGLPLGLYAVKLETRKKFKNCNELKNRINSMPVPIDKRRIYKNVLVTIIEKKAGCLTNTTPIFWRLIANLKITSLSEIIKKLDWYALKWRIEVFHKILKSDLKAESLKFEDAQRLVNTTSVFCILGWRVFWMTMINRIILNSLPELVFTSDTINLLNGIIYKFSTKRVIILFQNISKLEMLDMNI